jgi:hypothetical protein
LPLKPIKGGAIAMRRGMEQLHAIRRGHQLEMIPQ